MEKKKYLKPTMKVYDIQPTKFLLGSNPTEFGQLPATPGIGGGIGDDENKLA
ncbi:MAG: hypothetical protein J6X07_09010 [Prevotella sp.]|nr:hypothetical protein [Prevotella sp.]